MSALHGVSVPVTGAGCLHALTTLARGAAGLALVTFIQPSLVWFTVIMTLVHDDKSCLAVMTDGMVRYPHDLATRCRVTDDWGVDVIDELVQAVRKAREARAAADSAHEHVKQLILRVRRERGDDYGPADIENLTDRYFDRATISRMTVPEMGGKPPRKTTRRRPGS
jgi:hypothetical protein